MSDKKKNEEEVELESSGLENLVQTNAGACCGGEACSTDAAASDGTVVELSPATEVFIIISED